MKLNKIAASFALISGLVLTSCSEGQYWDEVSSSVDVYGFAKTAETVTIPAAEDFPSSYTIKVRRSSAGAELTVPVTHKSSSELFSGAPTVTFPAGSMEADYQINIAPGGEAGINYTDVVTLQAPENAEIHEDASTLQFTFTMYHELNWVNGGTVKLSSTGIFDTEGEVVDVQVLVATNWPKPLEKLCRLVSPFHALDPEEIPAGHDIWFILDDYNEAYKMYEPYQYTGYVEDEVGYLFFGTPASYSGYFRSRGNVFTMKGVLTASSTENASDIGDDAWNQTLKFTWDEYDWSIDQYGK